MTKAITLLRYPGGKTRGIKYLRNYLPKDLDEICSPFFGGGAFEMHMANHGIKVHGYDNFKPLVSFWQSVINTPNELIDEVRKYYPISKDEFYSLQGTLREGISDTLKEGAVFFVLNRASYSGLTLSGGMSPNHPRFTENSFDKIAKFNSENISVRLSDFEDSIARHTNTFLYCDPPYFIDSDNLYGNKGDGHKGFAHEKLFELLSKRKGWMLSYNNSRYIRKLYADFEQVELDWSYGTSLNDNNKPREILIMNY